VYELQVATDKLQSKARGVDIHGARKQIKRARAIVRLLRDAIGTAAYRRTNVALRNAARPLSAARDAEVLIAALDGLTERYATVAQGLHLSTFRKRLTRERGQHRAAATNPPRLTGIVNKLQRVERAAQRWHCTHESWGAVLTALTRIYRRGFKALRTARADPSAENLHEWRKQVKYLWHQMQLLEPLAPKEIGEMAKRLHELSDYLGDDHDLAVLKATRKKEVDEATGIALSALLDRRRAALQAKAFASGRRLYRSKPKRFEQRFAEYRDAWLADKA
jgi:CHAD domain-containing protein